MLWCFECLGVFVLLFCLGKWCPGLRSLWVGATYCWAFVSVRYFGCLLWFGGVVSGGFGYGVVFLVFLFLWLPNARLMLWLRAILGACCGFDA